MAKNQKPFVQIDDVWFNPESVASKKVDEFVKNEMQRQFTDLPAKEREAKLREVHKKCTEAMTAPAKEPAPADAGNTNPGDGKDKK